MYYIGIMRKTILITAALLMCVAAFSQNQALPKFSSGYPVADALVDYTDNLYQEGFVYETRGMARIGDWYLGQSVAAISSLRSAIGRIYRQMKENAAKKEQADDPTGLLAFANAMEQFAAALGEAVEEVPGAVIRNPADTWRQVERQISAVSPYPELFQGLADEFAGRVEEAAEHYANAVVNPYFRPEISDFSFLFKCSYNELESLSSKLMERENIYMVMLSDSFRLFDRELDFPWEPKIQLSMAADEMRKEEPDYFAAKDYCEAALLANPFDVSLYELTAKMMIVCGEYAKATDLAQEAIAIEPENQFFKAYLQYLDKKGGER